jgi:AbrB family looped-hinge helix DNA binding protein
MSENIENAHPRGTIRGKVSAAGRVVLPAELRKDYGIEEGQEVIFRRSEHGIQIMSLDHAIRQAQELVRRYIPEDVSLTDELHKARREDNTFE